MVKYFQEIQAHKSHLFEDFSYVSQSFTKKWASSLFWSMGGRKLSIKLKA